VIQRVTTLDKHHNHGADQYRIGEEMHCEVGQNGIVGLAPTRGTGKRLTQHLRLIWLRADTESAAHYRQEASRGSAASFDSLSLFSHQIKWQLWSQCFTLKRQTARNAWLSASGLSFMPRGSLFPNTQPLRQGRHRQLAAQFPGLRVSFGLLSVAHPARKLCDSISGRPLPP
jgi:hypothetical protein